MITLVYVCSPYSGEVERNLEYGRSALKDCFDRGEFPFAPHLLYTQPGILDDTKPAERALGMKAGLHFMFCCDKVVVYQNFGISKGMAEEIESAHRVGMSIEYRMLHAELPSVAG